MTTLLSMPSYVSVPCFIPASKASETHDKNDDSLGLFNDGELDFDLLADYLLEEADVTDFGDQPSDSVVTPDAPDMDFADPLADATFSINYPSTTQQVTIPREIPKPVAIPAPTIVNNAPPPIAAVPPPLAGMTGPPTLAGIASTPVSSTSQTMIVHHHKRQRIEPPMITNSVTPLIQSTVKPIQHAPATVRAPAPPTITVPAPVPQNTSMPSMHLMNNQIMEQRSGRQKSQAQIDRRRERNRILARRTRLRKKFFFESLQKEVTDLQKENFALKEIVRTRFEKKLSESTLKECKANEELPQVVLEHCGDPSALNKGDFNLMASVKQSQQSFVITDPSLQDNPIVYASDGFLDLTGYSRDQVLGRNCRFLQGTDTDPAKVAEIRKALQHGDDASVTFLNYCADGTPFWNKLFIAALRDAQNNIVNYIGVSVKVAGDHEYDSSHNEEGAYLNEEQNDVSTSINGHVHVDADATVMAIEGAVTAAVAAAPNVVKKMAVQAP